MGCLILVIIMLAIAVTGNLTPIIFLAFIGGWFLGLMDGSTL